MVNYLCNCNYIRINVAQKWSVNKEMKLLYQQNSNRYIARCQFAYFAIVLCL